MGTIAAEFKGLPMADLIGGPLTAACDAEIRLANATAQFIQLVGFQPPPSADAAKNIPAPGPDDVGPIRNVSFTFTRPVQVPAVMDNTTTPPTVKTAATTSSETVDLTVPLLAIVKVPALSIDTVDIVFDMEVKSSSSSKSDLDESLSAKVDASAKWGAVRVAVSIQGSVSSHKENTRSTDNSAKYHVEVHASDKGMPEGLSRMLDILQSSIVPVPVPAALPKTTTTPATTP
jgi:hypothetical protein